MANKYDFGIYHGIGEKYDYKDKSHNIRTDIMYMLNKTLKMFRYSNLPETIPYRELEKQLQIYGTTFIVEVDGKLYCLLGAVSGEEDVYGYPTKVTIINNYLKLNKMYDIGVDVIKMTNDDMGLGVIPILNKYVTMLNENDISMIIASINTRIENIMTASDDNTVESCKRFLDKVVDGDLGYIVTNKLFESFSTSPSGQRNTRLIDLVEYQQYIKASMFNEVGLKSNHNMKKERMIESEVRQNNDAIYPLVDSMLESRQYSIDLINKKWGTNILVELNSSWKDETVDETVDETSDEASDE